MGSIHLAESCTIYDCFNVQVLETTFMSLLTQTPIHNLLAFHLRMKAAVGIKVYLVVRDIHFLGKYLATLSLQPCERNYPHLFHPEQVSAVFHFKYTGHNHQSQYQPYLYTQRRANLQKINDAFLSALKGKDVQLDYISKNTCSSFPMIIA